MAQATEVSELQRFVEGFREEHRAALHAFLGMAEAFRRRDAAQIRELMSKANVGIGPHMRYEEEIMYPELARFFAPGYIEKMLQDHDRAFGVAGRLMELAAHDPITDGDIEEADRLIRGQVPHASECDGLALFIELLPAESQKAIIESRDRAVSEGLTMMDWAQRRRRSPIPPR